jgi:multicomponent Na+:H+ antiporter subunit G
MNELIGDVLMIVGAIFLLLAAVGVLRMPDLFTRMQPATKGTTMGIACTLLAVAVHFGDSGVTTRALAAIAFFFLTAPVTAHLIGRASYFVGVPLWNGTVIDELRGRYNPLTHDLGGPPVETIDSESSHQVDMS